MNAKDELIKLANGEEFEAMCVGGIGWNAEDEAPTFFPKHMIGDGLNMLDFEFDDGYGGEEGRNVYAWTKSKVIFKSKYDGSESYKSIPRNPEEVMPISFGGG